MQNSKPIPVEIECDRRLKIDSGLVLFEQKRVLMKRVAIDAQRKLNRLVIRSAVGETRP